MSLIWKRIKPLTSFSIVYETMEKYDLRASKALVDCIQKNNGGKPVPNHITASDGEEYDVKHLLSFNSEDQENFYQVINYFCNNYGTTMIPFAIDSGSNYFCEQDDQVVIWTQEDGSIIRVANSFEAFLSSLHE